MFPSTSIAEEDVLACLENDLRVSRENERRSEAALAEARRELHDAFLTIATQNKRLTLLTQKLFSVRNAANGRAQPTADEFFQRNVRSPICLRSHRDAAASERLEALWKSRPAWTTGSISRDDENFLNALIDQLRPERVYEIGVASGSSSAFILNSMATYADPTHIWLHSYDIAERCYFDPAYAVGDATRIMAPELLEHWKLNVGQTVLDVPREHEARSLYFIDANHLHPAPTLDLIALLGRLKPGDHVIFHDINLPRLSAGKFKGDGAHWIFEDWLGDRFFSDAAIPNIGAIVIPEDKNLIRTSLTKTLSRPWAHTFADEKDYLAACEQRLLDFLTAD